MGFEISKYLATQIYNGKLDEKEVYDKYPDNKEDIQKYLEDWRSTDVSTSK